MISFVLRFLLLIVLDVIIWVLYIPWAVVRLYTTVGPQERAKDRYAFRRYRFPKPDQLCAVSCPWIHVYP